MSKRKLKKQIKRLKRRLAMERAAYARDIKHYEKFHKCDMICRITDIEPIETPFLSTARKTVSSPTFIYHDWTQTDGILEQASQENGATDAPAGGPPADGGTGGREVAGHDGPHPA
jgi:hypothetical protein